MNIRIVVGTLIVGALLALAPSNRCLAETKDTNVSSPQNPAPSTHRASPKHRYWRFRGGKHPHYGSRRVRT
jgi:hypothetical protein